VADETVTVDLGGDASGLAASADAAAAAVGKLDAASAGLQSTVDSLKADYAALEAAARDATDPETFLTLRAHADKAAAAISKMEKELASIENEKKVLTGVADAEKKVAAEAEAAAEAIAKAEKEAEDLAKAQSKVAKESEKAADEAKKLEGEIASGSKQRSDELAVSIGTFVGGALLEATKKAIEFGVEIAKALGEATIEADRGKRAAVGLLETYEGADAAAAHYAKLSGLAKQLGVDANAVTKDFVEFNKKAGLSEAASVALIKLKADVEAIAPGTGRAEEATARFIELIKGGMSQEHALKTVGEEFHVVGDGAKAAAAKMESPSAAIDALKTKGNELAGKLAQNLGPKIIETADKFSAWMDKPETIALVGKAVDATKTALDLIVPTIEVVAAAFDESSASGAGVVAMGGALRGVVHALIAPFTGIYETAVLAVSGFMQFYEVAGIVTTAIGGALEAAAGFVAEWTQAGTDLVAGFVEGIAAGIQSAVAKATELGSAATSALRSVLDEHSPSKVAMMSGANFSAGFEAGIEPVDVAGQMKIPDAVDAVNENASAAGMSAGASAGAAAGGAGGASIVIQNVNITVGGAAEAADSFLDELTRAAARRGMSLRLSGRAA
jgi:hypothetical protein